MALNFNFNETPSVAKSRRLLPWGIYPVKFAGARVEEFHGKKDPTKSYKTLRIRFEGNDGYYEESLFFPQDGDDARRDYETSDGRKTILPSRLDTTMTAIAQVAETLVPEAYQKFKEMSPKFKNFDQVATAFIKITDSAKGKETKIKLCGRNDNGNIVPCMPNIVRINAETGDSYSSDNWIGDRLLFSAYEQRKKNEFENATPSTISDTVANDILETPVKKSAGSEDIDFEDLLK